MASWKQPGLQNPIIRDVPDTRELLNALVKQDPEGTDNIPNGAKRWADTPEGKQLQVFNGTLWSSVGALAHDAASVDGFSASQTVQKDTIPVRGSSGKIPGDITGNAATADTAAALSAVNPIAKGGTGAGTAAQARNNLGVPPMNHASTATTYGVSSATKYGHAMAGNAIPKAPSATGSAGVDETHFAKQDHVHPLKTSDAVDSDSSTDVASSKAVKTAYDRAVEAATDAGNAAAAAAAAQTTADQAIEDSGVIAGSYGPKFDTAPGHNQSFEVPYFSVDSRGRILDASTSLITLPGDANTHCTYCSHCSHCSHCNCWSSYCGNYCSYCTHCTHCTYCKSSSNCSG